MKTFSDMGYVPPPLPPRYLSVDYKFISSHLNIDEKKIKEYNPERMNILFNYYKFKNPLVANLKVAKLIIDNEPVPEKEVLFLISEYEKIFALHELMRRNFGYCNYNEKFKTRSVYIKKTAIYNTVYPIIKEFEFFPEGGIPMNEKGKSTLDYGFFYDMFGYTFVLPELREKIQKLKKNIVKEEKNFQEYSSPPLKPGVIY